MPATDREVPMLLRQFHGVNIAQDSAFIDPSYLALADSFIPSPQFLLSKREGDNFLLSVGLASFTAPDYLTFAFDRVNNALLFQVTQRTSGGDQIYVSVNEAAFSLVAGGATLSNLKNYNATVLGERIYIGNGTDLLKFINLGTPAVSADFSALGDFTHTQVTASVADPASLIYNGSYSYRWGVYNESTKVWVDISGAVTTNAAHIVELSATAVSALQITSPTAGERTLAANEMFHLFIAPNGLPIEFAHDHTPKGVTNVTLITIQRILSDTTPIPLRGVARRGKYFATHRARIWLAGDDTSSGANTSKVYASSTIVPGLEQALYDQGQFWPVNAVLNIALNDGDFITGLAVSTNTTTLDNPSSPLIVFKNNSTWGFFGDILDDDQAALVQLSGHIGCISHRSIVNTPQGLIFVGTESIYVIRPDNLIPIDIGWPIAPAIRAIPQNQRFRVCAIYHKQFYKVSIAPTGASSNKTQWWLDMRPGTDIGQAPQWWGPHTVPPYVAMAVNRRSALESDRGYGLSQGMTATPAWNLSLLQQANRRQDYYTPGGDTTIVSRVQTQSLDTGSPFQRKIFTRTRVNGRTNANMTNLALSVVTDGGIASIVPAMSFEGAAGAAWNTATWDSSSWGADGVFVEGESIFPTGRPRGQFVQLSMVHIDLTGLDLRDFELRYLPVERPVQ